MFGPRIFGGDYAALASPAYIIPPQASVLSWFNATDLNGGTARAGGAWTKHGTVPYNAGAVPRPSVGPFSTANYFTQLAASPANPSGAFSAIIIYSATSFSPTFSTLVGGYDGTHGYLMANSTNNLYGYNGAQEVITEPPVANALTIAFYGRDASNNLYVALNGSSFSVTAGGGSSAAGTGLSYVGNDSFADAMTHGTIFEGMVFATAPSQLLWTSIYNQIQATLAKSAYLIPSNANVVSWVNATDLNAGTAKVGGAWTKVGTVPANALDYPRPSVGPFSDSNYYTQADTGPLNFASGPFTVAMIFNPTTYTHQPSLLATGPINTSGILIQPNSTSSPAAIGGSVSTSGSNKTATSANTLGQTSLGIFIFGMDASGNVFAQLNGGTTATATGGVLTQSSTLTYLGRYTVTTLSFNGLIYELQGSTAVPSSAAFTAIYNAIIANI